MAPEKSVNDKKGDKNSEEIDDKYGDRNRQNTRTNLRAKYRD